MICHNPGLYDAVKSYVSAAISLITRRAGIEAPGYELDSDTLFYVRTLSNDDLKKLPEYQKCLKELMSDRVFTEQLDVLAGTRGGIRSRSQTATGLMSSLLDLGIAPYGRAFDEVFFNREYRIFEEAYYSPEIAYEAIAPIQGLLIHKPVRLSDDLEISPLRDDEIGSSNNRPRKAEEHDPCAKERPCAIRLNYFLPKILGEVTREEWELDHIKQAEVNDMVSQVITALRLSKIENVYPPTIIHKTPRWTFGRDRTFQGVSQGDLIFSNKVDDSWLKSFREFWEIFQSERVKKHKFLEIGIRRFGLSHERQRIEDKVLDLLIAAEALFLSQGSYTGELKYRMSLQAALFLSPDREVRRAIFRWMKVAYDLRSRVAHGGDCNSVALPKYGDGTTPSLEQFVVHIQEYIRVSVTKFINLANQTNIGPLVDWEELVLSNQLEANTVDLPS